MKIAGFYDESISNGEGIRSVVFFSGCPHRCQGCHNIEAQDYDFGSDVNIDDIIERIADNIIISGVTISGGEPLCPKNSSKTYEFITKLKKRLPHISIWCYSGYYYEQLCNNSSPLINTILNEIDVLVDGPYIQALSDSSLIFRGSSNQRILRLKEI